MAGPAYYTGQMNIAMNDDWIVPFLYATLNSDGVTTTPIDLTGSVLKMEVRMSESDRNVVVSVSSSPPAAGITITNAVGGAFTILMDRNRLSQLTPGNYVSDLVRLMPNGYQERMWEGTATVVEGTTR
jgi:hypothetical protein